MPHDRVPLLVRDDLNGFWALFADNLANLMIIGAVCGGVFRMPDEIVLGRILPGAGVALLVGLAFYAFQARRLASRENRADVTALPYGISTPILFVYLFGVIGPVYFATRDSVLAWQVGVGAAFLGGLLEALGALVGPLLKRITPRAGMLGTLAGIALVWIATVPLAEIFENALVGFPALAIILVGLVAGVRLPFGVPAGLLAILVGTLIGFATGDARISTAGVDCYPPGLVLGDLWAGLGHIFSHPGILMVVLPIEVYNFIETLNNVESAEAAGDRYDVRTCQVMDGVGTVAGALFGSPFPTTVYIGHPAYKRLGSRSGYALLVGLVFFLGNAFGLLAFLRGLIPLAAVAPMLVFVGLVICAQAFRATPKRHAVAVAVALLPHVGDLLFKKLSALSVWLQNLANGGADELREALSGLTSPGDIPAPLAETLAQSQGIHFLGMSELSRGAIISGLIWGSLVALLIERRFLAAAGFAAGGLVLALVGFIHTPGLGLHLDQPLVWGYGLMAIVFVIAHLTPGTGGPPAGDHASDISAATAAR